MKIIECNENFIRMFDEDALIINEMHYGLEGASLEKMVPFADLFRTVLQKGLDINRDSLHINEKIFNITIFTIETNQVVGGVILDVTGTEMHREQIALRARQVIRKTGGGPEIMRRRGK